jgi:hypothetical protein
MDRLEPEYVLAQYARRNQYHWQNKPANTRDSWEKKLLKVAKHLQTFEHEFSDTKTINSWHSRFYYTNHDTAINALKQISEITVVRYRQADVCLPSGVLLRKNNPYQYRTYFRERRLDSPDRGLEFLKAIKKYGNYFRLNDTTQRRLALNKHRYPFGRHSYIEHNSSGDRVMLEMMLPGFFGSTIPIQAK